MLNKTILILLLISFNSLAQSLFDDAVLENTSSSETLNY